MAPRTNKHCLRVMLEFVERPMRRADHLLSEKRQKHRNFTLAVRLTCSFRTKLTLAKGIGEVFRSGYRWASRRWHAVDEAGNVRAFRTSSRRSITGSASRRATAMRTLLPHGARLLFVADHPARLLFELHPARIPGAHKQPVVKRIKIVFGTWRHVKYRLTARIHHDGVVEALPKLRVDIFQLCRILMRQGQMKPKATRLVEVFGDAWGNKVLKFVDVGVERFDVIGVLRLTALLHGSPQIGNHKGRESLSILARGASALGKRNQNDSVVIQSLGEIE